MNNTIKQIRGGKDFKVIYPDKEEDLKLGRLFQDEYPEPYMNYKNKNNGNN